MKPIYFIHFYLRSLLLSGQLVWIGVHKALRSQSLLLRSEPLCYLVRPFLATGWIY